MTLPAFIKHLDLSCRARHAACRLGVLLTALVCLPPATAGDFELGACIHLALNRGDAQTVLPALAQAGFTSFRDDMYWAPMEQQRGNIEMPARYRELESAIDALHKAGGSPLVILDFGNDFYDHGSQPTSPEAIEAFQRYVRFVVTRFKDRVNQYEVWNEWNTGFGTNPPQNHGDATAYVKLLARTYATIKAINPHARVIGGSVAGADLTWCKQFFAAGGLRYLDAFSVHSYTLFHLHSNPEVAIRILDSVRAEMQRATPDSQKPILITEMGWPTNQGRFGVPEGTAADYMVRFLALARARPWIQGIWWYDLIDDGTNHAESEQQFGLLRSDLSQKPAYTAASRVGRMLAESSSVRSYALSGSGYAVVGHAHDRDWLIAWKLEPDVRGWGEGTAAATDVGTEFEWVSPQLPDGGTPLLWERQNGRWVAAPIRAPGSG